MPFSTRRDIYDFSYRAASMCLPFNTGRERQAYPRRFLAAKCRGAAESQGANASTPIRRDILVSAISGRKTRQDRRSLRHFLARSPKMMRPSIMIFELIAAHLLMPNSLRMSAYAERLHEKQTMQEGQLRRHFLFLLVAYLPKCKASGRYRGDISHCPT